jgi:phage-related protein
MSFTQVQDKLSTLFGGAAAANAETYAGKMARVQVAIDEAKETLGNKLLPILETFINFINQRALPFINAFANGFSLSGNSIMGVANTIKVVFTPIVEGLIKAFGYVKNAIGDNLDAFKEFGGYISTYLAPIIGTVLGGALQVVGKIAGGVIDVIGSITKVINSIIGTAIDGINALIRAYNAIPILPNIPTINKPTTNTGNYSSISGVLGSTTSSAAVSIPTIPSPSMSSTGGGGGGVAKVAASAAAASSYVAGSYYNPMSGNTPDAPTVNLTVNQGIVGDPEAAARSVVDVLNRSFFRGTGGANALLFG